jgi:hypothetical protein
LGFIIFFLIDDVTLTTRFGFHSGRILEPFVSMSESGRKLKVKPQAVKMQNMTMMIWKLWLSYS